MAMTPLPTFISRGGRRSDLHLDKPIMIRDYTKYMGGVDRADHYCSSYAFIQKSLKWWRKIYFFILEVAIVNSFILFNLDRKEKHLKTISHKSYRKQLIEAMVGSVRNPSKVKKAKPSDRVDDKRHDGTLHINDAFADKSKKDCIVCSVRAKGKRKETRGWEVKRL